jgi:hypothetical protein
MKNFCTEIFSGGSSIFLKGGNVRDRHLLTKTLRPKAAPGPIARLRVKIAHVNFFGLRAHGHVPSVPLVDSPLVISQEYLGQS